MINQQIERLVKEVIKAVVLYCVFKIGNIYREEYHLVYE